MNVVSLAYEASGLPSSTPATGLYSGGKFLSKRARFVPFARLAHKSLTYERVLCLVRAKRLQIRLVRFDSGSRLQ